MIFGFRAKHNSMENHYSAHICCLSKLLTQFFHLHFYGERKHAQSKPINVFEDEFKNSLSGGSVVH